ncbi:MAG TPA: hypothetical protein VHB27_07210 [Rhodopila sp.]|uniref:GumC family protein n=1 Tax=Rhodopila sp. TaxID=2480087 RepID=UPI002CBE1F0F|nr:hypothetical protein [Rhodopila sp.]HVY14997.1 hypothetical protein [Rhodopila sp.]
MSDTLALPPRLMMRDLMLTAATQKGRVLLIFFCVLAVSIAIAVNIKPDYKAHSSLLVLMGTEHTFRPAAGQQFMNSGGVDAEEVLRTEAGILGSDDLHRSVIKAIGIQQLYPKLLEKPSLLERWFGGIKRTVTDALGMTQPDSGSGPNDVMSKAADLFARNLTITVDKKSSVIGLDFTNPDRALSAEALHVLEEKYFALRAKLYNDIQAPIVLAQQQDVGKRLAAADAALQSFKQAHDISNFADRRQILMRQQGDLELALARSEGTIAGLSARLEQLNHQLASATGSKKGPPNAASALEGMVQTYRQREVDAQTRYRGSPAVDEARRQMLERETDIARMRATEAYGVQADRNKTDADLRTALAAHDALTAQLNDLNKQINSLDADETQLDQLTRNRSILEDNYKSVSKILDQRQVIETVEAKRESSVRVIQPPLEPALPLATRRLILMGGFVVGLLLSIGSILMAHFFQAIYLRPEALEMDTGLAVLAAVPEMRSLGRASGSILVVPG